MSHHCLPKFLCEKMQTEYEDSQSFFFYMRGKLAMNFLLCQTSGGSNAN